VVTAKLHQPTGRVPLPNTAVHLAKLEKAFLDQAAYFPICAGTAPTEIFEVDVSHSRAR
jgi:hypothetical protein